MFLLHRVNPSLRPGCQSRFALPRRQSLCRLPDFPADAQATRSLQSDSSAQDGSSEYSKERRTPTNRCLGQIPIIVDSDFRAPRGCACALLGSWRAIRRPRNRRILFWPGNHPPPTRNWQWPLRIATHSHRKPAIYKRINRPDVPASAGAGDSGVTEQRFNLHAQATIVAQGDPPFAADYSGPNSLNPAGERQQTLSADLFVGLRLWQVAAGTACRRPDVGRLRSLSQTFGIEDFPNGDAYKAGTEIPDFMLGCI